MLSCLLAFWNSFLFTFSFPSFISVKKSVISQDLQAHAQALWGLLPAFCRYPTDTHQMFEPLAKLLITFLKDSTMRENIAVALQVIFLGLHSDSNLSIFPF